METFVINEPRTMCCGQPKNKCTCKPHGLSRPEGLPVPEQDFGSVDNNPGETQMRMVNNAQGGALPIPEYDFSVARKAPVENTTAANGPTPLALPEYIF